ncbi:MAG: hypothetical protein IOC68_12550, partial [Methylobacterium sp.]|nr:hypothetical protein [Methylobacterium sp.]
MVDYTPPARKSLVGPILLGTVVLGLLAVLGFVAFIMLRYLVMETTWFVPLLIVAGKTLLLLA